MSLHKTVAANIKNHRILRGISQQALAVKAKVSTSYISMLERGEREGSLSTFEALATALKIPVVALFTQTKSAPVEAVAAKQTAPKATKAPVKKSKSKT